MRYRFLFTVFMIVTAMVAIGCTDDNATISTLNKSGYTDIEITGYSFWECGQDDTFHTGFRAKNPKGDGLLRILDEGMHD
jgi:hypothetical protein